ncbi:uncharacterized protein LOC142354712 [Convolutriloba macropyga]|uniref:uncharacterized protein LOC142354666 n=1 Tax=Convolutriloba macropyga TaxID=536237 RepID=UPI003F51F2D9
MGLIGFDKGDLFGCFTDFKVCLCTFLIPCYVRGKIAESVGKSCLIHTLCFFVPILNVVDATCIRSEAIGENIILSLLLILFCFPLATCQEARVKNADLMAAPMEEQAMDRA